MKGFLRRAGAHLGRALVSFGLGGASGDAPVVVDHAGCGHMAIEPTSQSTMVFDPTATGVLLVEATSRSTLTFETC